MAVTTAKAAERLGVSTHEVRRLIAAGELSASRMSRLLLVDEESLLQRERQVIYPGRALAPNTAWAALLEVSGERAEWLDRATRSRLKAWLRRTDAEKIAVACRRRAQRYSLRVLPTYQQELLSSPRVVLSGITVASAVGADIIARTEDIPEFYCDNANLNILKSKYGLVSASPNNLIVRVPKFKWPFADRRQMPIAVIAVDLLESAEVRTRRAGRELLETALSENL